MTTFTRAGFALTIVTGLWGCGHHDDARRTLATTAEEPSRTEDSHGSRVQAPEADSPRWPKTYCSIISPDDVAAILGKPVTSRVEVTACHYFTDGGDEVWVHYWSDNREFEIFKGLQDKRGSKSEPVSGLGVEALYGATGTGAGLAVLLADGRSFTVEGSDRKTRFAVAKLVVAKA